MIYYNYPPYYFPQNINMQNRNFKNTKNQNFNKQKINPKSFENSFEKSIQESHHNLLLKQFPHTADDRSHQLKNDQAFFEILGIKLYFDDILLLCLIFFLYSEGVQDQYLFIALILLLLS